MKAQKLHIQNNKILKITPKGVQNRQPILQNGGQLCQKQTNSPFHGKLKRKTSMKPLLIRKMTVNVT